MRSAVSFSPGQRRLLHDAITKQNYTLEEIKEIAQEIKELHPNK